ncbi:hypothetical protein Tco_0209231 [Tanacetum coccineum]
MAQSQSSADVHQDELCPPNKRYALMDANKKVDLENPLCPDESRILVDILKNHPLRFSIVASSSVPWIYLEQTIFHLPQATDNNHDHFIPAPTFSEMVSFYNNDLGFTLELRSTSNFKTTGLLQPWQTLCKIIALGRISLLFNESDNTDSLAQIHKANRKSKGIVGMKIPDWMIIDEMKLTENYQLYVKLVEGSENVEVTSSPLRNDDDQVSPGTRLEPMSDKESPKVEKIADISQPVNVIKEEEESAKDDYELRITEKGKYVEEIRNTPTPTTIRSPRIPTNLVSSDTEKL